jgi:hypothetical protein
MRSFLDFLRRLLTFSSQPVNDQSTFDLDMSEAMEKDQVERVRALMDLNPSLVRKEHRRWLAAHEEKEK